MDELYLDNAATTRLDPRVEEALSRAHGAKLGNASSIHGLGVRAAAEVERARQSVASALGAAPEELFFTGSGTESNNWALIGACLANRAKGDHLIVSAIEHPSVLAAARWLTGFGFRVTEAPVDAEGRLRLDALKAALTDKTVLVSVMHANNEVGALQDLEAIAALCASRKTLFHTDACQSFTRAPLDVRRQKADLVSVNAHKIHGPRGVAALFVRKGTKLDPFMHGGGQETGLRSGTLNVEGIAAFGVAAGLPAEAEKVAALRDALIEAVLKKIDGSSLNGPRRDRVCHNANFTIAGASSKKLLFALDKSKIYVSIGSACASGKKAPSHVLRAMGRDEAAAGESLRVTLSKWTTQAELERFVEALAAAVDKERAAAHA